MIACWTKHTCQVGPCASVHQSVNASSVFFEAQTRLPCTSPQHSSKLQVKTQLRPAAATRHVRLQGWSEDRDQHASDGHCQICGPHTRCRRYLARHRPARGYRKERRFGSRRAILRLPVSTRSLCKRNRHPPDYLATSTESSSAESSSTKTRGPETQSLYACPEITAFEHCCAQTCYFEPTVQCYVPASRCESTQPCETSICGTCCPSNPATSTCTQT